jgi:hypothetical protein
MRILRLLALLLALPLLLVACRGSLSIGTPDDDDDSAAGDDDDAADDDDATDDDDAVDDDDVVDDDDIAPDDDDLVPDDDDIAPDDDDAVDHYDCGPWDVPGGGGEQDTYTGYVWLEETVQGWYWEGCEAQRFFENGNFDCERVWLTTGYMYQWDAGDESAAYSLEFDAVNGFPSSCGNTDDQEWRYLIDYDFGASELDLYYGQPEGGNWNYWAHSPFWINGGQTQVEFEYSTGF